MGTHLKNISLYIVTGHWLSLAQKMSRICLWLNLKNDKNRIQIISLGIKDENGGDHDWGITMAFWVWINPELYTVIEKIYGIVFRSVCKW